MKDLVVTTLVAVLVAVGIMSLVIQASPKLPADNNGVLEKYDTTTEAYDEMVEGYKEMVQDYKEMIEDYSAMTEGYNTMR